MLPTRDKAWGALSIAPDFVPITLSRRMTRIPQCLAPTCEEAVLLQSGSTVQLPKATPLFKAWRHDIPFDRYGRKAILDFRGEPLFAELVILRLFDEAGWDGVWVDTYRHCFRVSVANRIEIPKDKLRLLEEVYAAAGAKGGCFDVFVWRGDEIMFAESKRAGRDRLRTSQLRWLDAALRRGLQACSFLVVEWSLDKEPNHAPQPTRLTGRGRALSLD